MYSVVYLGHRGEALSTEVRWGYWFSGSVSIVKWGGGGVQATYSVGSVRKNLNHLPSHAVTKEINRVLS
jgi:hypothetical protein